MWLRRWIDHQQLPLGVGIDLVCVSELKTLDERLNGVFVQRTFTEKEQAEAAAAPDVWVYLAGRFAVKEAVFKALAHLIPEKTFDFRRVETLSAPDGSPHVSLTPPLTDWMHSAGADQVLVSISNQGDYAVALAQVSQRV